MKLKSNSWQARLDKALLDVDVGPGPRFRNFQRALKDPSFPEDLRSAVEIIQQKGFGKGHPEVIEKLWPTGTTARADIEGLAALRKQAPEILEDLQKIQFPFPFEATGSSSDTPAPPDPTMVFESLTKLATDPEAQKDFTEEVKNSLRSTPKGLETPKYTVVGTLKGPLFLGKPEVIELRAYPEFTMAKTSMDSFTFGSSSGAEGFGSLASYLFGKNEDNKAMKMTMPVEISAAGNGAGSMAFILPESSSGTPPAPLSSSGVTIEAMPARLVAAKSFGGVVTDQEVERQKATLLEAIADDGSVAPVDDNQISVLQYNSPLTIPWRRRNEIAIVVERVEKTSENTEVAMELKADTQIADEPIAETIPVEVDVSEKSSSLDIASVDSQIVDKPMEETSPDVVSVESSPIGSGSEENSSTEESVP